jgi:hypothetical protein
MPVSSLDVVSKFIDCSLQRLLMLCVISERLALGGWLLELKLEYWC